MLFLTLLVFVWRREASKLPAIALLIFHRKHQGEHVLSTPLRPTYYETYHTIVFSLRLGHLPAEFSTREPRLVQDLFYHVDDAVCPDIDGPREVRDGVVHDGEALVAPGMQNRAGSYQL